MKIIKNMKKYSKIDRNIMKKKYNLIKKVFPNYRKKCIKTVKIILNN